MNVKLRTAPGDLIFNVFLYTFMLIVGVVTIYPFLNVLAISLNDSVDTVRGGDLFTAPYIYAREL